MPFAWGSNDCCLFAADCVKAVTGRDPAADLRGAYSDAAGAARMLAKLGGVDGIADQRACDAVPPSLAQPGDIGRVTCDGRPTLAVCMGGHWLAPGEHGLVTLLGVDRAWRCC